MKQNKYSILPAIIEALIILTTSMLTLLLREVPGMMTYIIPVTLLAVYILLKFFYRKGTSWIHRHATSNPTSTFPPQNFPVIQHLQFLHIYCGYYKFSNSTELG